MAQACDKIAYRDMVKMIPDTSEVKLRIRERYVVQITPGISNSLPPSPFGSIVMVLFTHSVAFRCSGLWPRSASHWPLSNCNWPPPNLVAEVKAEGFDLLSKECVSLQVQLPVLLHYGFIWSFMWILFAGKAEFNGRRRVGAQLSGGRKSTFAGLSFSPSLP